MTYNIIRKGNRITLDRDHWESAISMALITEIDDWVTEAGIGIRVAYATWRLNDGASVTLFILRWGSGASSITAI